MVEGSARCAKPRSIVIPRAFSSGKRSGSMPVRALTRALLPWSTWPAVATMKRFSVMVGPPPRCDASAARRDQPARRSNPRTGFPLHTPEASFDLASEHRVHRAEKHLVLARKNRSQIELEPSPGEVTDYRRVSGAQLGGEITQ